eukprot:SAG31_NODE_8295_length_1479_cov_1.188406_3_plen_203_part_00
MFGAIRNSYNGDGYSFQVCDDIHFYECTVEDCYGLGFHPGSGSQRPRIIACRSARNAQGIFFCWGVTDGLAERCTCLENDYGVTIGHRDTDNKLVNCVIERNKMVGLLVGRPECRDPWLGAHRNIVEGTTFRDNGDEGTGCGAQILQRSDDVVIRGCTFIDTGANRQKIGIEIGSKCCLRVTKSSCENNALMPDVVISCLPL